MGAKSSDAVGSTLGEYGVLDSEPEDVYDRLTALAARYTDSTIAGIGLLDGDREWFKSIVGGGEELREHPLEHTFCRMLLEEDQLVVSDADGDCRFDSLPVVTGPIRIRAYAGVAIKAYNGDTIGSFCILSDRPRDYDDNDLELLRALGKQAEELLEMRRTRNKLQLPAVDGLPSYRELTQRLAMLYDHSTAPFYMVDEEWRFVYMNEASARFLDHERDELLGNVIWEHFPEANKSNFRDRMFEVARSRENQTFELFFKPLESWFEVRLVYADPGVAVFYNDITTRVQRVRQVTDDEERFRLLTEITHDALFDWDIVAGKLAWSSGVEELTGYSGREITDVEFAWENLLHPEDLEAARSAVRSAFDDGDERWSAKSRWIRKDGRVIRVTVDGRIIRDRSGAVVRALGGIADQTERVFAADRMQMLASLLDKAGDAIMVYDRVGRIEYWNESAEALYGWSADEVSGRRVNDLIYVDSKGFFEAQAELIMHGEWQGELVHKDREGQELDAKVKWTLAPAGLDGSDRIFAIHTDVTESNKLEMQLLRVQRLETIGRLAGGLAHDLNNILSPILSTVSANRGLTGNPELEEDLELIETSVKRGAEMIRQLLEFARGAGGTLIPTDLDRIIEDVERLAVETFPKSIEFVTRVEPDLPTISAVPTQIHQVLTNLIVNAKDAMPVGGTIEISGEQVDATEIYGLEEQSDEFVRIRVQDTGVGIPEAELDRIFEPFYTTKEVGKGTGLGLSTVHRIVTDHGGTLNVESEEGVGTSFSIFLPVDGLEAPDELVTSSSASHAESYDHVVIVVDDEEAVRRVASTILRRKGYEVLTATDGADALRVIEANPQVDLVLLDMAMPVMDGAEAILALRTMGSDVVIIASSGFDFDQSEHQTVRPEIFDHLPKPYDASQLLESVQSGLSEARKRKRARQDLPL